MAPALAVAAPWPPAPGDLILGVQASDGAGSTTDVFFNLGPAHVIRDNPVSAGVLVNLDDDLTAAFGADWATRPDLYFGVFANFTNSPPAGSGLLGSVADTNGDPGRTIYTSKGTGTPQMSTAWTGFSVSALSSPATIHQGQITALAAITANGNEVATLSQSANPVQWNNGWSSWNPVPGPAFSVFSGGIQRAFATVEPAASQTKMLDVYRIPGNTGDGAYITTIYLADNGDLTFGNAFVLLTGSVPGGNGSITGLDEIYPQGATIEISAVPALGFGFTGWGGDAAGMQNPLSLLMDGPKNVTATFAQLPSVISPTVTDITTTGATLGGNVDADGGSAVTARGVVYAEYATNDDPEIGGGGVTNAPAATNSTGTFTVAVAGLTEGTTYAYKAYVTTAAATVYTDVAVFTTDTNVTLTAGIGSVTAREILAGGIHRFRFSLAETRLLQLSATDAAGLLGRLLDSNGNVIATGNGNFLINKGLAAGDYVIEITGGAAPATFSLALDATGTAAAITDVSVGTSAVAPIGAGVYAPVAQAVSISSKGAKPVSGYFAVDNDGPLDDTFTVQASPGNGLFKVAYFQGSSNVTAQVIAGTYTTPSLAEDDDAIGFKISVTPNKKKLVKKAKKVKGKKPKKPKTLKKTYTSTITATATSNGSVTDSAKISVKTL